MKTLQAWPIHAKDFEHNSKTNPSEFDPIGWYASRDCFVALPNFNYPASIRQGYKCFRVLWIAWTVWTIRKWSDRISRFIVICNCNIFTNKCTLARGARYLDSCMRPNIHILWYKHPVGPGCLIDLTDIDDLQAKSRWLYHTPNPHNFFKPLPCLLRVGSALSEPHCSCRFCSASWCVLSQWGCMLGQYILCHDAIKRGSDDLILWWWWSNSGLTRKIDNEVLDYVGCSFARYHIPFLTRWLH